MNDNIIKNHRIIDSSGPWPSPLVLQMSKLIPGGPKRLAYDYLIIKQWRR